MAEKFNFRGIAPMASKCPKCENLMTSVNVKEIEIRASGNRKFKGASFDCPHCQTSISIELDPLAMQTDLVRKIKGR
jgi:hypothetical protein